MYDLIIIQLPINLCQVSTGLEIECALQFSFFIHMQSFFITIFKTYWKAKLKAMFKVSTTLQLFQL